MESERSHCLPIAPATRHCGRSAADRRIDAKMGNFLNHKNRKNAKFLSICFLFVGCRAFCAEMEIADRLAVDGSSIFKSAVTIAGKDNNVNLLELVNSAGNYLVTVSTAGRLNAPNGICMADACKTYWNEATQWTTTGSSISYAGSVSVGTTSANEMLTLGAGAISIGTISSTPTKTTGYGKLFYRKSGDMDSATKLLLHLDTNFTDSSPFTKMITPHNHAQISAAQKKFGAGSCLFDGSDDYLTIPDNDDFDFGTGDFTVEAWIRPSAGNGCIYSHGPAITDGLSFYLMINDSNQLVFVTNDSTGYTTSNTVTMNTWTHVAAARYSGTVKMYINGTAGYTGTFTNNYTSSDQVGIGVRTSGTGLAATPWYFNGYIDEVRVSKGIARWTSDFSVPVSAYGSTGLIFLDENGVEHPLY